MWHQGEHVLIVGRTGQGKTFAARELLKMRQWAIALVTKRDPQVWWGWRNVATDEAIKPRPVNGQRWQLTPTATTPRLMRAHQAREFEAVCDRVWREENWTIYADELYYLEAVLGLALPLTTLWTQGRSQGITCVGGCQRPARINRFFISEPRFIIAFAVGDGADRARLGEIVGDKAWAESLVALPKFEYSLYDKEAQTAVKGDAAKLRHILGKE